MRPMMAVAAAVTGVLLAVGRAAAQDREEKNDLASDCPVSQEGSMEGLLSKPVSNIRHFTQPVAATLLVIDQVVGYRSLESGKFSGPIPRSLQNRSRLLG